MKTTFNNIYRCSHLFAEYYPEEFNHLLNRIETFNGMNETYRKKRYGDEDLSAADKKKSQYYFLRIKDAQIINKGYVQILEQFSEIMMKVNKELIDRLKDYKNGK